MPAFRTEADLRQAIDAAGIGDLAGAIVATARPALLFTRRQQPDDPLPVGTNKIGGLPDLPGDFTWPERPSYADAAKREEVVRSLRSFRTAGERTAYDIARDHYEEQLFESYRRSFPLAFRAQLDLGALANEPGFDADLPRRGFLSVFEDPTADGGNGVVVFWHDVSAEAIARRPLPADLAALSDAHSPDDPWKNRDSAEVLTPFSAVTLAHHWIEAVPDRRDALYDLVHSSEIEYSPGGTDAEAAFGSNFADRLGGWADPIQKDPEAEFDGQRATPTKPGDDHVRHLFTWGGEYYGGTRLPSLDKGGDGYTHVLIPRAALLARRFSEAGAVYQGD